MRHGDVAYFADSARRLAPEEVVLTPAGLHQAREAGRALAQVRFDRVITSGLPRTLQTARLVVEHNDQPEGSVAETWPELQELRPGEVSEIPDGELEDSFLGAFRGTPAPTTTYLRGETVGSLMARVAAAMERLFADRSWNTILLVLHGGVNRAILSWALAGTGQLFAQFEQSPGAINIIDGEPGLFVLRAVNITPTNLSTTALARPRSRRSSTSTARTGERSAHEERFALNCVRDRPKGPRGGPNLLERPARGGRRLSRQRPRTGAAARRRSRGSRAIRDRRGGAGAQLRRRSRM